jgi:hypothetical protein
VIQLVAASIFTAIGFGLFSVFVMYTKKPYDNTDLGIAFFLLVWFLAGAVRIFWLSFP